MTDEEVRKRLRRMPPSPNQMILLEFMRSSPERSEFHAYCGWDTCDVFGPNYHGQPLFTLLDRLEKHGLVIESRREIKFKGIPLFVWTVVPESPTEIKANYNKPEPYWRKEDKRREINSLRQV